MAIAFVGKFPSTMGNGSFHTPTLDTTGADGLIGFAMPFSGTPAIIDSFGNSFTLRGSTPGDNNAPLFAFDSIGTPTVGAGHYLKVTGCSYGSIHGGAFSGIDSFDKIAIDKTTTFGPGSYSDANIGSITPTNAGSLIVSGVGDARFQNPWNAAASPLVFQDSIASTTGFQGGSWAYYIQSAGPSAVTPTFTGSIRYVGMANLVYAPASGAGSISGSGDIEDGASQIDGAGNVAASGAGDLQDGASEIAGGGAIGVAGSGDLADGAPAIDGSGDVSPAGVAGSGDLEDGAPQIDGSGVIEAAGTGDIDDGAGQIDGAGKISVDGGGDLADGAPAIDGGGDVAPAGVAGSGDLEDGQPQIDGAGEVGIGGSGSLQDKPAAIDGGGAVAVQGSGDLQDGPPAIDGTGTVSPAGIAGSGDLADGAPQTDGAGEIGISGGGSMADGAPAISGSGTVASGATPGQGGQNRMVCPIETGYRAFGVAIRGALMASGFNLTSDLEIDPPGPFVPAGDETVLVTAAALVKLTTRPIQTFMGSPRPRYIVERAVNLELAAAGPDAFQRQQALASAALSCAAIASCDPDLGGIVNRIDLGDRSDDDLPPNGAKVVLTFSLRVRANDPLGMT